jgi:hypothetical protein
MFMRKSYYILRTIFLPGWKLPQAKSLKIDGGDLTGVASSRLADVMEWKSEPHVFLANLGYDAERRGGQASNEQVEMFTARYGPLDIVQGSGAATQKLGAMDALEAAKKILASSQPEECFWLSLSEFRRQQSQLRDAWQRKDANLFTDPTGAVKVFGYDLRPINWHVRDNLLEMVTASCRDYVGVLLARDIADNRARICQRPRCPAPYFVANRIDQKFCSHKCASDVSQNNFRKRHQKKPRRRKR